MRQTQGDIKQTCRGQLLLPSPPFSPYKWVTWDTSFTWQDTTGRGFSSTWMASFPFKSHLGLEGPQGALSVKVMLANMPQVSPARRSRACRLVWP